MSSVYSKCLFVVSSRFDDRFFSWNSFHTYQVLAFEKNQSREVIEKTDFDTDIKKEFLSEILEKRYEDYKSFFATPLLTLMMLMTYLQIRHIPEDIHSFYRYAFQTLYTLHDASKQGFQRARRIEMSESQFIHNFSLFCLASYAENEHSFYRTELETYLDRVKVRTSMNYKNVDFIDEAVESVNLLHKDGDLYSFTHRSFQEYFCAYAATHYFPSGIRELSERIPARRSDSVFSMMYQINKDLMEEGVILPTYNEMSGLMKKCMRITDPYQFLCEYKSKLYFVTAAEINSHAIYSDVNSTVFNPFLERMVCMFKSKYFLNEGKLRKTKEYMTKLRLFRRNLIVITKGNCGKNERMGCLINIVFDFEDGSYSIRKEGHFIRQDDLDGPVDELMSAGRIREFPGYPDVLKFAFEDATIQKAKLVFVSRICDSMLRNRNKSKDKGDILGL